MLAQNVEDISDLDSEMTDAALIVCKAIVPGENVENVLEEDSDDSDILLLSGSADLLDNEVPSATFHTLMLYHSLFSVFPYPLTVFNVGFGLILPLMVSIVSPSPHLLFVVLTFPMPFPMPSTTSSSSSIATHTQSQKCKKPGGCCVAGTKR